MELITIKPFRPVLFLSLASEGMGHATRARTLIQHLAANYDLHVFCGGTVYQYLKNHHHQVHEIPYVKLTYRNNRLNLWATIRSEAPKVITFIRKIFGMARLTRKMKPVALISDFEFISSWSALLSGVKVISFDNMHLHPYAQLERVAPEDKNAARMVKRICRINVPMKHKVLVSSFFKPPLKARVKDDYFRYIPCSVRDEVLLRKNKVSQNGPVLVYQTSQSNDDLHATLEEATQVTSLNFAVYGSSGRGSAAGGRIEYRAFNEDTFLDDMAAAPFVMINGGHSAICEALSLGKPVLAEPIQAQYEQILNGVYLEKLGVGMGVRKLTAKDIQHFEECAPLMGRRAAQLDVVDTEGMIREIRQAIDEVGPTGVLWPETNKSARSRKPVRLRALKGLARR
ncbi:MAG: hypothetical protein CMH56_07700 [Myxococcales bacterium]|nr:hypothetical protein [Myxococcales bacterium]